MKDKITRIISSMLAAVMCVAVVISAMSINDADVYAASASLSGPGSGRAGDTFTVTLDIAAAGSYGLEANLNYDGGQVTLVGTSILPGGWKLESNGNKIIAYDDTMSNPLGGSQSVIQASFRINDSAAPGTDIGISFSNILVSDANAGTSVGTASCSVNVLAPLSSDNALSSLTVSAGELSPGFSPDNTGYNLGEVEYDVSSINVNASARDSNASVSVGNTSLSVGDNTIYINVTAENGNRRTYTLRVTRKQDPNYVPSSNANLSDISVSYGQISPAFSSDITEYVVYIPYEVTSIEVAGSMDDSKAAGATGDSSESLAVGSNDLYVTGVAEDGTEKKYHITVVRMPEYAGVLPKIEGVDIKETQTEEVTEVPVQQEEVVQVVKKTGIKPWLLVILVIAGIAAGFAGAWFGKEYIKKLFEKKRTY